MVVVGSAEGLKRVFQTNQRNYVKDLDFSFHPFLPILGTGLVTAQGALWQSQRLLMAPTLRVDVLDDVVSRCVCEFLACTSTLHLHASCRLTLFTVLVAQSCIGRGTALQCSVCSMVVACVLCLPQLDMQTMRCRIGLMSRIILGLMQALVGLHA